MLDDGFTYGGLLGGLAALALWLRLAVRALPTFDTLVARYADDLPDDSGAARAGAGAFGIGGRLAASLTVVALVCSAIGYAIPD